MSGFTDAVDRALEFTVVPSFTRIGPAVRRRLDDWDDLSSFDLTGRTIVVTGATSGLGEAAARQLRALGADLIVVGRSADKLQRTVDDLSAIERSGTTHGVRCDMGELDEVRAACAEILDRTDTIHALVHNAGALVNERRQTSTGTEVTIASQVVGPHLMTCLLFDALAHAAPGRVITMTSGGMYTAPLSVDDLELAEDDYNGTRQYALAKRAQVTMTELWAQRIDPSTVTFHTVHPGWADTPGVSSSLPAFGTVVGPLLRTPDEGADTLVWLCAADRPLTDNGSLWLDRRTRPIHRTSSTKRSDTPSRRRALWDHVTAMAELGAPRG